MKCRVKCVNHLMITVLQTKWSCGTTFARNILNGICFIIHQHIFGIHDLYPNIIIPINNTYCKNVVKVTR